MNITILDLAHSFKALRDKQKLTNFLLSRSKSSGKSEDKEIAMQSLAERNVMESKADILIESIISNQTKF